MKEECDKNAKKQNSTEMNIIYGVSMMFLWIGRVVLDSSYCMCGRIKKKFLGRDTMDGQS